MDAPSDALQAVNFINYDFNYDYSTLPVTVGGSQQVLLSMVDRIRANNTRMQLNTKIVTVSSLRRATRGYRYLATTSRGDSIRAKRVVFAIPPGALKQMTGDIVERLKRSKFVSTLWQNRACTWNVFFPTNWWQRLHTSCNTGYCTTLFADGAFTLDSNTRARNYATWSAAGQHDIPFLQYVGTDERQAGKLLRIYLEEEECEPLARDLEVGGQGAVKDTMMARLRRAFPLDTIPNPTGFFYRDEEFAYSLPGIGADYTNDQLLSWASRPLDREGVCMASEGYNFFDGGWQEAAAVSAHRCLGGPVFSDIFHPADIAKFERCTNVFTGRVLDKADPQYDQCLLLANEASMRDLAGLDFCGGPSTQAIVSEGNDTISVSSASSDWEGAATERVAPDSNARRVHRYSAL